MEKTKKNHLTKKGKTAKKPIKKPSKKTTVITILSVIVFLGLGGTLGYIVGQSYFSTQDIDYSKYSAIELEDDKDELMKKYQTSSKDAYLKAFKPYEFANIALEKIKSHQYVQSQTIGLVNAMGVKQTIRATSIKQDESYFLENISVSSMVQTAKRFYQEGDEVKTFNGKNASAEKATWEEKPDILSKAEHEEKWGKDLSRPSIYIISKATTLDSSKVEKDGDGYKVSLDLNPKLSVLRYVKQMISISGVQSPKFKSIHLEMTLDSDLSLIKTHIHELYTVIMVVKAESDGELTEYYTYDQKKEIPDLKTNCDYSKGEK